MIYFLTVIAVAAVCVHGAPQEPIVAVSAGSGVTPVAIISQSETSSADGSFNYTYEAANGIKSQGSGFPKKIVAPTFNADGTPTGQEEEQEIIVQTGSYSYTSPDGQIITLNYIADENGFQPVGDHLPVPPPIPEQILSSLKQQSANSGVATAAVPQQGAPASAFPPPAPLQ